MYFHRDINPTVAKVINEALGFPASRERPAGHQQSLKPSGQPGGMNSNDPDMADFGNALRLVPGPLGKRARTQKKKALASPAVNEVKYHPNGTIQVMAEAKAMPSPDVDGKWIVQGDDGKRVGGLYTKEDAKAEVDRLVESKARQARKDKPVLSKMPEHINANSTVFQPKLINEMKVVPSASIRNGYYVVDGETRISGTFIGKADAQAELVKLNETCGKDHDDDRDKKKKKYKKKKGIDAVLLGRLR